MYTDNFRKLMVDSLQLGSKKFPVLLYIIKWFVLCGLLASLVGSASAGFLISLDWATSFRENHTYILFFLPLGGLFIGLLYHYFGKKVESGNNLIIDYINGSNQKIPLKMGFLVYFGTIVTHLLGGSAGREGTALQMAGAIAQQLIKPFRLNKSDKRTLIIAAVAAGFGAVFGTPLAGAVFALEFFVIGKIRYEAIFPAFISAILADFITKSWQVNHTLYAIESIPEVSIETIIYSIVGGVIFGLCAALFSKLISFSSRLFKSKITYAPLRPIVGGIIIVVCVWAMGSTKYIGLGIPFIELSFKTQASVYDFILKIAFTVITLSTGFKGGEVTPLFFIGATLGSALSLFVPLPVALMAGMGFVAVFAGATNTPLACIIMGLELFGEKSGVYIAIACVASYLISGHNSVYNSQTIGVVKNVEFLEHIGKKIKDLSK